MNLLNKDLTLSHRTIIWNKALELIREKPIWGYGLAKFINVFLVNHDYIGGNNNVWTSISGHNQFLQLIYYFVCTKKEKSNNYHFKYFFLGVIEILINWMSEVPSEYAMFFMLGLCFYSERSMWGMRYESE